ncbi:MAG: DoxX family protein [Actinomycetota bacterium]
MRELFTRIPSAPGAAALVLRVTVGIVLLAHGLAKIEGGVESFAGSVGSRGIPFPTATAYATVAIEVLGGPMLVLGLGTRVWAVLASLLMVGTTLVVKWDVGLLGASGRTGMELDLLVLAGALAVALLGPGRVSVDHVVGLDRAPARRGRIGDAPTARSGAAAPADPRVTITLDDTGQPVEQRVTKRP